MRKMEKSMNSWFQPGLMERYPETYDNFSRCL